MFAYFFYLSFKIRSLCVSEREREKEINSDTSESLFWSFPVFFLSCILPLHGTGDIACISIASRAIQHFASWHILSFFVCHSSISNVFPLTPLCSGWGKIWQPFLLAALDLLHSCHPPLLSTFICPFFFSPSVFFPVSPKFFFSPPVSIPLHLFFLPLPLPHSP